jgi:16S rRNA (guanine527-N7)-methyltransferase
MIGDLGCDSAAAARLREGIGVMHLPVADALQATLLQYLAELSRWNQRFNLTAVTDPVAMVERHLLDSLSLLTLVPGTGGPIVDVGTGAGLPGIVIAACRAERQVIMVDAVAKKIRFVTHAIAALNLTNANGVHARCEDYQPPEPAELVTARAVASPQVLVAQAAHMLAPDGSLLAMCGVVDPGWEAELAAMGWRCRLHPLDVPGLQERNVLQVSRRH